MATKTKTRSAARTAPKGQNDNQVSQDIEGHIADDGETRIRPREIEEARDPETGDIDAADVHAAHNREDVADDEDNGCQCQHCQQHRAARAKGTNKEEEEEEA